MRRHSSCEIRKSRRRLPQPAASLRRCRSRAVQDRKSTRLNSSHSQISYAVFCLKKKNEDRLCYAELEKTFSADLLARCRSLLLLGAARHSCPGVLVHTSALLSQRDS